jgi:hypothetical protein
MLEGLGVRAKLGEKFYQDVATQTSQIFITTKHSIHKGIEIKMSEIWASFS